MGEPLTGQLRRYSQHFHLLDEPHHGLTLSAAERDAWSERSCGLACLRTLLNFHGLPVPRQAELLGLAIEIEAFSDAGMIHHKLVEIGGHFGLAGQAVPVADPMTLFAAGAAGFPSIASITRKFPVDGRRGGHLVVTDRLVDEPSQLVRFVDPSRWGRDHDRVPLERFGASFSGRAIVWWPDTMPTPPAILQSVIDRS